MNILVSGGAGFIGSNLCFDLAKDNHNLTVVDDCSTGKNWNEVCKVVNKMYKVNVVTELNNIPNVAFYDLDIVFNLVGRTFHSRSMTYPKKDIESNIVAPFNILQKVSTYSPKAKVIYTGSRSQYGKIKYNPVDENHPIIPVDVNGINKNTAEQYHTLYANYYGMDIVCFRLGNIFGPRHQVDTSDGVLNWFIIQALRKNKIEIYGGYRDVLFVDDCVKALKETIFFDKVHSGKVFNLGGFFVSLESFVKIIERIIPVKYEVVKKIYDLEVGDYKANYKKFFEITKWKPQFSLYEGIKKTIDFYNKGKGLNI